MIGLMRETVNGNGNLVYAHDKGVRFVRTDDTESGASGGSGDVFRQEVPLRKDTSKPNIPVKLDPTSAKELAALRQKPSAHRTLRERVRVHELELTEDGMHPNNAREFATLYFKTDRTPADNARLTELLLADELDVTTAMKPFNTEMKRFGPQ